MELTQLRIRTTSISIILIIFAFSFLQLASQTNAADFSEIITRPTLFLDEKLSDQSEVKYKQPKKILFSNISTKSETLSQDSQTWVKNLFYYSITRLGFADMPYNYLIDRNGNIYQGRGGYIGAIPELENLEGVVLIGYLSNGTDITTAADVSISNFITDISRAYGISRENVLAVDLKISKGSAYLITPDITVNKSEADSVQQSSLPRLSKLVYSNDEVSPFAMNLVPTFNKPFYTTNSQTDFTAKVSEVKLDKDSIIAGDKFSASMLIENLNSYPWFLESKYIYASTTSGSASEFAVNAVWDSSSKAGHITGITVLPSEKVSLNFPLQAPSFPRDIMKESFKLIIDPGIDIKGSEFDISVNVTKGDGKFVEILPTGSTVLNVRSCSYIECNVIAQVTVGRVYRVVEESNGWYKISFDGSEGWIGGLYAKPL